MNIHEPCCSCSHDQPRVPNDIKAFVQTNPKLLTWNAGLAPGHTRVFSVKRLWNFSKHRQGQNVINTKENRVDWFYKNTHQHWLKTQISEVVQSEAVVSLNCLLVFDSCAKISFWKCVLMQNWLSKDWWKPWKLAFVNLDLHLQKLLFALKTQTRDPTRHCIREQLLFSEVPHTKQKHCKGSRYPSVNKPPPLINMDNRMETELKFCSASNKCHVYWKLRCFQKISVQSCEGRSEFSSF